MFDTSYGQVEAALVQAYRIPDKAVAAFRGRLGNLQRKGLFGAENMPGRGAALVYTPDMFHRLVFCCELFEFGIFSPATVLALVELLWESRLSQIFKKAEHAGRRDDPGPDDVIMHMGGVSLMTDTWSDAVPNVNYCTLQKLNDHMQVWMRMGKDDRLPARALVVNLSSRLRLFHTALAHAHPEEIKRTREQTRGRPKSR